MLYQLLPYMDSVPKIEQTWEVMSSLLLYQLLPYMDSVPKIEHTWEVMSNIFGMENKNVVENETGAVEDDPKLKAHALHCILTAF